MCIPVKRDLVCNSTMGITSCHYRLLTAIILPGISRVRAHTRFVMSARGNDASYMQGVLEIAHSELHRKIYDECPPLKTC